MRLVWHHFRKDLRALRWVVAAWLGVLSLGVVSLAVTSAWGGAAGGIMFALFDYFIGSLDTIAILVMVPLLVHQEPLVGTAGAWLTRPLSRAQLLASKALFVVAVILVPSVLAETAALASNEISAARIALAAVEGLFFRCALVLPVAGLAALTPGFARFAVWAAGAWVLSIAVGSVLFFTLFLGADPIATIAQTSLWPARQVVGSAVLILAGAVVTVHQYLTRRTHRSTGLAAAGLVLVVSVHSFWPWPLHTAVEPPASESPEAADVRVSIEPDGLRARDAFSTPFSVRASGPRRKHVWGDLLCSGLPPGTFCQLDDLSGQLSFEDGTVVPVENASGLGAIALARIDADAVGVALGAEVSGGVTSRAGYTVLFQLDRDLFESHGRSPATLEAMATVRLRRYRVVAELPLAPGARVVRGSEQVRLADVLEGPRSRDLVLVRTRVRLRLFDREPPSIVQQILDPTVYALVNRPRRQAVLHDFQPNFNLAAALSNERRLEKTVISRSFGSEDLLGQQYFVGMDAAWFAQARLVLLDIEELGVRRTALRAEGILLDRPERRKATLPELPELIQRRVSLASDRLAAGEKDEALRLAAEALESDLVAERPLGVLFGDDPDYAALLERVSSLGEGLLGHYESRWGGRYPRNEASAVWAIWSLGAEHRDAESVPHLLRYLAESRSEEARWRAADALWLIGDRRAVPQLVIALKDPSLKVRGYAASALGDLGDRGAVPALLEMFEALDDNREEAKARAADALGKLGDPRAIAPLTASLERIRDPEYVHWTEPALQRLRR